MERIKEVLNEWLNEIGQDVREAVSILDSSSLSGIWWAGQIRRNMTSGGGPEAGSASGMTGDRPETLIEISFWSGWLKGQLDALELAANLIEYPHLRFTAGEKSAAVTLESFSPVRQTNSPGESTGDSISAAKELLNEIDMHSSIPELDVISISMASALEGKYSATGTAVDTAKRCLHDFVNEGSSASLAMLSFHCGLLTGASIAGERSRLGGRA
ncbi:MAG: hypothetical protein M1117_01685 [Candidatus Thermoplasmatota archaeon]|nr:hypothetical protein [Candidatus Thermoplasmatota archaeon]